VRYDLGPVTEKKKPSMDDFIEGFGFKNCYLLSLRTAAKR